MRICSARHEPRDCRKIRLIGGDRRSWGESQDCTAFSRKQEGHLTHIVHCRAGIYLVRVLDMNTGGGLLEGCIAAAAAISDVREWFVLVDTGIAVAGAVENHAAGGYIQLLRDGGPMLINLARDSRQVLATIKRVVHALPRRPCCCWVAALCAQIQTTIVHT